MDKKSMPNKNVNIHSMLEVEEACEDLQKLSPKDRLKWAYKQFGDNFTVTTSFGIQSAVLLHMLSQLEEKNKIAVIWIDTGYLPAETYQYADQLTKRFELNLKVIQSDLSPARMEALYGQLWKNNNIEDMEKYHQIRKVEPLENALEERNIICWASGVRKNQTNHRNAMKVLDNVRNRLSLRPILDWNQKDIFYYMQKHNLPQHPLFEKGYSTVGDWHSSGPDGPAGSGRDTRFKGLKQECGIHVSNTSEDNKR